MTLSDVHVAERTFHLTHACCLAGRILNRFSSDSSTVDDSLPFILNILLANIFSALGILAVLLWTQSLLLLPCIPLFFSYRYLARYYQVLGLPFPGYPDDPGNKATPCMLGHLCKLCCCSPAFPSSLSPVTLPVLVRYWGTASDKLSVPGYLDDPCNKATSCMLGHLCKLCCCSPAFPSSLATATLPATIRYWGFHFQATPMILATRLHPACLGICASSAVAPLHSPLLCLPLPCPFLSGIGAQLLTSFQFQATLMILATRLHPACLGICASSAVAPLHSPLLCLPLSCPLLSGVGS